jgi:predicted O-methyltransferase YrrM
VKFFTVWRYLKYIFFSGHKKGHGIHSPFVFNLIIKVFRNKISPEVVFKAESIRKKMISDKRQISMLDLGAGSEIRKEKYKRVSEIAKYSSVPKKYGLLLSSLAAEYGKEAILELGTSFGISTLYMAAANQKSVVYTVEGSPAISEIAGQNFKDAGVENILKFTGSFEDILSKIESLNINPGLVFIDGNHRKEPTLCYFDKISRFSGKETIIVIDDIYYSQEMGEAWEEIKRNDRVSFTVDIFRMGFVFFREGMTRFDYIIRY